VLLLRANLVELAYQRGAPLAIFGVQAIEIAGGLVVPILAVVTLVMMPYISAEALRRAARIVAGVCILTLAPLPLTAWLTAAHPASRGNSAAPVHRQFTHAKLPV
jgi:hypothetical protein